MAVEPLHCKDCGVPVADIENGALVIKDKHHGETHVNVYSIWDLVEKLYTHHVADNGDGTFTHTFTGRKLV